MQSGKMIMLIVMFLKSVNLVKSGSRHVNREKYLETKRKARKVVYQV